jgi:hypothetical protein
MKNMRHGTTDMHVIFLNYTCVDIIYLYIQITYNVVSTGFIM